MGRATEAVASAFQLGAGGAKRAWTSRGVYYTLETRDAGDGPSPSHVSSGMWPLTCFGDIAMLFRRRGH